MVPTPPRPPLSWRPRSIWICRPFAPPYWPGPARWGSGRYGCSLAKVPAPELGAEEAARSNVMALLQAAVGILHERKLVRDIDVPILVLLVVTGLPSMMLGAKSRPGMLGEPTLPPRERFVGFFVELLKRQLLPGPGGE